MLNDDHLDPAADTELAAGPTDGLAGGSEAVQWRMPAEWEPHERCLVAWPTREDLWEQHFEAARREYAATIEAILQFEPVTVIAKPGDATTVRSMCPPEVEIIELPIDDSWIRDSGPIFVVDDRGHRRGVDFGFNSWGEKFLPYAADADIARQFLASKGELRQAVDMVLEGGAITVDGEGTLITTEQCLLNPNRNPTMDRQSIEAVLRSTLGVEKIVWLPFGGFEDAHTDGHVDGVCTFVAPGRVIAQSMPDKANPNYELMRANLEVLRGATDARGRSFDIVELPQLPYVDLDGLEIVCSYPNFFVANGGVVVPVGNCPLDAPALELIGAAFPDREVVGVPSKVIAFGGGGTHCITQQIPRAAAMPAGTNRGDS